MMSSVFLLFGPLVKTRVKKKTAHTNREPLCVNIAVDTAQRWVAVWRGASFFLTPKPVFALKNDGEVRRAEGATERKYTLSCVWIAGQLLLREQYAQPRFAIHHLAHPHPSPYRTLVCLLSGLSTWLAGNSDMLENWDFIMTRWLQGHLHVTQWNNQASDTLWQNRLTCFP